MPSDRPYDLVLFGASGFTGGLTARYLGRTAPPGLRWALAGRNRDKLTALRTELAAGDPALADLPLLDADVTDPAALGRLAAEARVLASTVGPYQRHGEPLVAACAAAGTDYLDITGEPEFVDEMYLRHQDTALRTGARLVHACGFDSVPHDLGAYFTVRRLPRDVPINLAGYVRAGGRFSAGTYHSALLAVSRRRQAAAVARKRRRSEPAPAGRRVRALPGRPGRVAELGVWALPMPTIDPLVVRRSAAALPAYGPEFSYSHYVAVRRLRTAVAGVAALAGVAGLIRMPMTRNWLAGRMTSGQGPSAAQRAKGWFSVRFVGHGGGQRVVTEVSGGDPGYDETAKMLGEAALSLALDELPPTAGQVTTAVAMGDALTARLSAAGIGFRVLDPPAGSAHPPA